MTDIVIHGVPGSPFLRAVQMGLEEKQVSHRVKALAPGEIKSEAYLGIAPPNVEMRDAALLALSR